MVKGHLDFFKISIPVLINFEPTPVFSPLPPGKCKLVRNILYLPDNPRTVPNPQIPLFYGIMREPRRPYGIFEHFGYLSFLFGGKYVDPTWSCGMSPLPLLPKTETVFRHALPWSLPGWIVLSDFYVIMNLADTRVQGV